MWCDKQRPTTLNRCDINEQQSVNLKKLIESKDFPHLLVCGPSGSGKRTRIHAILRDLFGSGASRVHLENKTLGQNNVKIDILESNFHIEVNPSDVGPFKDRIVVQELIKEMATSGSLIENRFKVILIQEAEKLSLDAQHSLRRTMEKYATTCRIILCAETASTLIPAIKSRCLLIRIRAPNESEIAKVLQNVARKENFNISESTVQEIAIESERNLRRALLMLETMQVSGDNKKIPKLDWKEYIKETCEDIKKCQTLESLQQLRERIALLETYLIPTRIIFEQIVKCLLCETSMQHDLVSTAAEYQFNSVIGSKKSLHLEAFICNFISNYKNFLQGAIDDDDELFS